MINHKKFLLGNEDLISGNYEICITVEGQTKDVLKDVTTLM